MKVFRVARNPDPESSLPYLVHLPVGRDGLVLKVREPWPRTAKVYCHRAEGWPTMAEVVEEVPVRSCDRRGVAIDLVLDRGRESRSQFVFTRLKGGREAIFWQSTKTNRASRPGVRVPKRRASGIESLHILVDTRERYPYKFANQKAGTERRALPAGDYGVEWDGTYAGLVERKSLADFAKAVSDGSLQFQMADLATHPHAAVVVEDRYAALFKLEFVQPGWIADQVAAIAVRHQSVPITFCDTRPLAEEWTFRFLGAALALEQDQPDDPIAPRDWIP